LLLNQDLEVLFEEEGIEEEEEDVETQPSPPEPETKEINECMQNAYASVVDIEKSEVDHMKFPQDDVDKDEVNLRVIETRPFSPFGNIACKIKTF
jgi:hypothetical protein